MFFKGIELDAFGALREELTFKPGCIHLLQAPNEAGKTTLLRALEALLYGRPEDAPERDGGAEPNARSAYRPRHADRFHVSGVLVAAGTEYEVSRDLGNGEFTVVDRDAGGDVTRRFDREGEDGPGRLFTGLSRSAFRTSVFVNQDDLSLDGGRHDLVEAIQRMADSPAGETTARRALDRIEEANMPFSGRFQGESASVDEEVERVEERLERVRSEMDRLETRRDRAREKIERAREMKDRIEDIEEELDRVDLFESMARMREHEERLEAHRRQKEKLDELKEKKDELEEFEGFPHGQHEHLLRAHEQRKQMTSEIQELEQQEEELTSTLKETDRKLEDLTASMDLDPGEVKELLEFCEQALYYRSEIEELRREQEREREELEDPDRRIETYRTLHSTFGDLDAEDREILAGLSHRLRDLSDQEAEAEREIGDARDRVQEIDRERGSIKLRSTILASTGGVFLVSGVSLYFWWADLPNAVSYGTIGVGIALGVYGLLRLLRADHHRSDERSEWKVKLERRTREQSEQIEKRKRVQKRATGLAGTLGLEGINDLLDRYDQYRNLYEKLEPLLQVESRIKRLQTKLSNLHQQYEDLLDRCEQSLTPSSSTDELQALKDDLRRYRDQLKRKAALETEQADLRSRRTTLERKRAGKESTLRSILDRAGIDPDEHEDLDEAVDTFREHHEKYIRLQSLKEKIPEIQKQVLSPRKREETRRMYRQLQENLEQIRDQRPDLEVPDDLSGPETYNRKRASLEQKKRSLIAERADLERAFGTLERRFRRRWPELQDERDRLEAYLERLERLREAIDLATDVLDAVSRDVHAEWARTLNQHTSRVIEQVVPSYRNVQFDADLSFTIETGEEPERLSPERISAELSRGTREQIHLAVRLGLARYLCDRNEPLPILLDEPFAHCDDRRYERFMHLLTEHYLPDHQILFLTAHASRVEWLRERNPDWFEDHVETVSLPDRREPADAPTA